MAKELVEFEYSLVESKDTANKLIRIAGDIKKSHGQSVRAVLDVGESLSHANELLSDNKLFAGWLRRETPLSKTTAYRYMAVFETFKDCESVEYFELSAMYSLSQASAPPKAVKEAKKLTAKGRRIDTDDAKELIEKYTVQDTPPDNLSENENFCETAENIECEASHSGTVPPPTPFEQAADVEENTPVSTGGGVSGGVPETATLSAASDPKGSDADGPSTKKRFDNSTLDDAIGRVTRLLDDKARVNGGQCTRHSACMASLKEFHADWQNWKKVSP